MSLDRLVATRKTGAEPLRRGSSSLGPTLLDFWRWSVSDLVDNTQRGVFAEFLVATAIGARVDVVRESWATYDLTAPDGTKIEVKSAAYLQAWRQQKLSTIQFVVPKRQGWDSQTGRVDPEAKRHADVYVFALLAHQDKSTVDPMDVEQWEFYVLPTHVLEVRSRSQHSITLASLRKMTAAVSYDGLRDAVFKATNSQ